MKKWKVVLALLLVLVMAVSLPACGGGNNSNANTAQDEAQDPGTDADATDGDAPSYPEYHWKIATTYTNPGTVREYNSYSLAVERFCELVNERSGGAITIDAYYDGTLGTSTELFEMVQRGQIEMYFGQPMSSYDSRFGMWSVPYLFKDLDEVQALACDQDGAVFQLSKQWLADNGVELLAVGASQFRGFFCTDTPVYNIEDIKMLKCRVYSDTLVMGFWDDICNASPMSMGEVYTSMQTNAIDGLEFAATSGIARKLYEVCSYYTDIDWQWVSAANLIFAKSTWDGLEPEVQELLTECAVEMAEYQGELERADTKAAEDYLAEQGMTIIHLTDEQRQTWIDYARTKDDEFREFIGAEAWDATMAAIEEYRAQ